MKKISLASLIWLALTACNNATVEQTILADSAAQNAYKNQPLVSHIFTADPSAHVFNNRIYIYPSHDTATGTPEDDLGTHFDMRDYHILSMDSLGGVVTDHGVALDIRDVPWAGKQMWAPDAAFSNGKYYLYFPAKDKEGVFRIGVAMSEKPEGPFISTKEPIKGAYSIDPCVFKDEDGSFYMYFGGIWGGQLQRWNGSNEYDPKASNKKGNESAVLPRMARLNADMTSLAEPVHEIQLLNADGQPFTEKDNDKRFFEAPWVFKKNNLYYFTYSTGDTHNLCYATGNSPNGPFTYKGVFMDPVDGWTSHHSILQVGEKWLLFYHDVQLSGKTHLRNIKATEITFNADGSINKLSSKN